MSSCHHGSTSFGIVDRRKSSPVLPIRGMSSSSISSVGGDASQIVLCRGATTTIVQPHLSLPQSPSPSRSQSERRSSSSTAMVKKLTRVASRSSEGLRCLAGRNKTLGHVSQELREASSGGDKP